MWCCKIESRKLEWSTESKIGSLDNATHVPGGGRKKIENRKLEWNVDSRVGSLENAHHTPGGGTKKVAFNLQLTSFESYILRAFEFLNGLLLFLFSWKD